MVQKHFEHGADKNLDEIRHTYRHTRWWHTIPPFVGRYRVHNQIALPYSKGYWIGQKQAHTNLDNVEYLKNHLAPEPELNHTDIHQEDMDFSTYILEGLPKNDKTCVSQNPFMGGFSSFGIKKITMDNFFSLDACSGPMCLTIMVKERQSKIMLPILLKNVFCV